MGFKGITVYGQEVTFDTESQDIILEAVSGGLFSLIDIVWRLYMFAPSDTPFVCVFDEPENHLHPEVHMTLMPNLLEAFPHVQFIVATHSPFVVTSVQDSSVYVLSFNSENRVESALLDDVNKAGTPNEILRDVLGLPFTMPLWAEKKYREITQKYENVEVTDEAVAQLDAELEDAGLGNFVPSSPQPEVEE